ncbi:type VI secretion protein [Serratia sp. Leaf50]|nr:type VI secretion protein [Serratia sp. Leaf50]
MERESQSAHTRLIRKLAPHISYTNFYRFCQLLEHSQPDAPCLGSTQTLQHEPVRFRPHPGMGFPASELKSIEINADNLNIPPSVRTTFIGLYGVESPLPTSYIDDIAQRREGCDAVTDFLDIFNHRLTTQFYRIWRKYSYPASFESGGSDETSQYLLGLVGLGIPGSAAHIGTPVSRFLALLGVLRLPTRTAEGIMSLVKLLAPHTLPTVTAHDRLTVRVDNPTTLSCRAPSSLAVHPLMGKTAKDVNSQILLTLTTSNPDEARAWFPGEQLHSDLLALLHVYLGARLHARLQLKISRSLLPDARLCCTPTVSAGLLGWTAIMKSTTSHKDKNKNDFCTISLGRYQCVTTHPENHEAENGEYQY